MFSWGRDDVPRYQNKQQRASRRVTTIGIYTEDVENCRARLWIANIPEYPPTRHGCAYILRPYRTRPGVSCCSTSARRTTANPSITGSSTQRLPQYPRGLSSVYPLPQLSLPPFHQLLSFIHSQAYRLLLYTQDARRPHQFRCKFS